jgi:hypothetical protein
VLLRDLQADLSLVDDRDFDPTSLPADLLMPAVKAGDLEIEVPERGWTSSSPRGTSRSSFRTTALSRSPRHSILPNRSSRYNSPPRLLQSDQHGERPLELAIQVNLISRWHIQIVGGICDAQGLIPDCVPVLQLRDRVLVPNLPM